MKHFFACLIFLICLFSLLSCDQTKEKSLTSEKKEKISVICPTYNRHNRHANLYSAFKNQTYENKELLILDDSSSPSDFFIMLKDPTVKYQHVMTRDSIGQKRNMLIEMASGSLIAHFDDDDYYAPSYLETMVQSLGEADLIKLSKWLVWKEFDGSLWEWDTRFFDTFHYIITGNNENTLIADTRLNTSEELDRFTVRMLIPLRCFSYAPQSLTP